ncbi:MAG TPA: PEP-CTERM sorting domain-containing protein [Rhodanobacteraceae bacterium]
MKAVNKLVCAVALAAAGSMVAVAASATPVTMTFDELATSGVGGGQYVADYYDGGCGVAYHGGPATCGGPDYGVVWTGAAVAQGGLYGLNAPSTPNILVRGTENNVSGAPIVMNVANGFTDGFSFYYSSTGTVGSVTLYSGLDGTGDVLYTTGKLAGTPAACPSHSGLFACWNLMDDFTFDGVVHSVGFDGPSNRIAWDNVSFDTRSGSIAVPEPAELGLFGLGLLLVGGFVALRRRTA